MADRNDSGLMMEMMYQTPYTGRGRRARLPEVGAPERVQDTLKSECPAQLGLCEGPTGERMRAELANSGA